MAAVTWTDYVILVASKDGKRWKVQINPDGKFRCSCPDFIFGYKRRGEAERNCKHCRWAEADRAGKISQPLPSGTADRSPLLATAQGVVQQMLVAGGLDKMFKSGGSIADQKLHQMALAVMPFLAHHGQPTMAQAVWSQHEAEQIAAAPTGVREIVFED